MRTNQPLRDPPGRVRRRVRPPGELEEPILAELFSVERLEQHAQSLAAAHSFFTFGGPQITLYVYRDKGNVNVYSWSFFLASIGLLAVSRTEAWRFGRFSTSSQAEQARAATPRRPPARHPSSTEGMAS